MENTQDTRKITDAMYLVPSTKPKENKKPLEGTESYFHSLQDLIRRTLRYMPDVEHSYLNPREEVKKEDRVKGLIVITGDRGPVDVHNHNVLRMTQGWTEQSKNHRLYMVGELRCHYSGARYIRVEQQFHYTVQNSIMYRACLISFTILEDYEEERLDEVWIIYTQMLNSMQMEAETIVPPPLKREDFSSIVIPASTVQEEIQMVPSPSAVTGHVIPNYMTGFIFDVLVEFFCGEQNTRMTAMQFAGDNANTILNDLSIEYNRVRQATITQEITKVISDAKAQRRKHP